MKPTPEQIRLLICAFQRPITIRDGVLAMVEKWESIRPAPEPPSAERIREFLRRPRPDAEELERAEFEEWQDNQGNTINRKASGEYQSVGVELMWNGWKVGRAGR